MNKIILFIVSIFLIATAIVGKGLVESTKQKVESRTERIEKIINSTK